MISEEVQIIVQHFIVHVCSINYKEVLYENEPHTGCGRYMYAC